MQSCGYTIVRFVTAIVIAMVVVLAPPCADPARAADIQVLYAEPVPGTMPQFGSVPFPNNLYYDGGAPGAGDGTLINNDGGHPDGYETFGIEVSVLPTQDRAVMAPLNRIDGFGVTTPTWFFFDGPIDETTLPGVPVPNQGRVHDSPSAADTVFLVEVGSSPAEFIPVKFSFDFDDVVPNVLAVVPFEGTVLKPNTDYAAVVQKGLKGVGGKLVSTADFEAAKAGPILSAAVSYVSTLGVASGDILGMTVYTTQTTTVTLADIRTGIVEACTPTVNFTGGLVFTSDAFFGVGVAPSVATVASGYYESPRLQSLDPTNSSHRDGSGGNAENDLPIGSLSEVDDEMFEDLGSNGAGCDLTVVGTPDGLPDVVDIDPGTPGVLDMSEVPVSLAVPTGSPPAGGWPVIIVQHGLGGHRSTTLSFAEGAAAAGFAVIGIDAVDHGLRWDETDAVLNFAGGAGSDGIPDGSLGSAVNFGFFEAFSNMGAIRDNFRQTYTDIMMLSRLLSLDAFDTVPGVDLDGGNIYYIGLSLGGLVGAGATPYSPEMRAVLLDAPGGQLSTELFLNSTIGSGAFALLQGIFTLDPDNVNADYTFFSALTQHLLDAGDGAVSAPHYFEDPFPTPMRAMNVIVLEDMNDSVVPNQATEAIAVAAGFEMFDPHIQNLVETARALPVVSTTGFVEANVNSGANTAAVVQVGPAVHAVITEGIAGISLVTGFSHVDEFRNADLQSSFPPLLRPVRVKYPGLLPDVYDWFDDIVIGGEPGRFTYTGATLNHNSSENQQIPAGQTSVRFFDRTLNADGTSPYQEPTLDVSMLVDKNTVEGRLTVSRSTLGATGDAGAGDMPPLTTLATSSVLPFFVGVQRPDAPAYSGVGLTIEYSDDELSASGCVEDELFVARYNQLTALYDELPTAVHSASNEVTVQGYQGADGIYAVMCDGTGLTFNRHITAKKLKLSFSDDPGKAQKGLIKGSISEPVGGLVIAPDVDAVEVVIYEDRDTVLFQETMSTACWAQKAPGKYQFDPATCGAPGSFGKAKLSGKAKNGVQTYKFTMKVEGALGIEAATTGGGGAQMQLNEGGDSYNSTGARCKGTSTKIVCSKYD